MRRRIFLALLLLLLTPATANLVAGACLDVYNAEVTDARAQYAVCLAGCGGTYGCSSMCSSIYSARLSVAWSTYYYCKAWIGDN